ncbi:hypothetical protein KY289_031653 [Solanum tuberosum]|nr:hypothetical protein KY289_031653 [Solanum tuberosum]
MNSIWEKVMSSLRAQFFQRVLIQKGIPQVVYTGVYIRSARFSGEVQVKRISRAILESLINLRMHVNLRAVNAKDIRGNIIVDDTILPSSLATTPTEDGKENRAGNGKNPTKGRVRNKTKKILDHAGKSVGGGIKKVMSRKASGKSKEEVESSETERLSSVEFDSADAEVSTFIS